MSAIGAKDPQKAPAWADENLGGMTLKDAVSSMLQRVAQHSPQKLPEIVSALAPGGVKQQASETMVLTLVGKDVLGAYDLALEQNAAGIEMRDEGWGRLGWVLGSEKPEEARSILANLDGQSNEEFRRTAMRSAFEKQPEETKKWAAEMEGEKRQEIIDQVFRAWSFDQKKAEAWRDDLGR